MHVEQCMIVVLIMSHLLRHHLGFDQSTSFSRLRRLSSDLFVLVVESVFEVGCLQDLSGSGFFVLGLLQALIHIFVRRAGFGLEELAMSTVLFLIVI